MLRSLFTGISGLTAHQQMLDVTANNIANVNTIGFKSSRTVFQDTLSQTIQGAGAGTAVAANAGIGGTNSKQIGLGVKLGGTEMNMTQGANEATGVGTDLMINGDGFFAVYKGGNTLYTRAGSLHLDADPAGAANSGDARLVTPDGALVMGWPAASLPVATPPAAAPTPLSLPGLLDSTKYISYTIDQAGKINATKQDGTIDTLGQISLAQFSNPNGLVKNGNSEYTTSVSSGQPAYGAPKDGAISAGYLEMSNVDLSAELTNLIIAQRGFQANSKSITTADQILQTLVSLKQ